MKKNNILKFLCVGLMLTSFSGCKMKTQEKDKTDPDYIVNEYRTTDGYTYDWIDFVDIEVYGSDGVAYVEVTTKDIKASDFNSDADYISIKSVLDSLNLNYVAGGNNSGSKLTVSPDSNLSVGDVVTLSLSSTSGIDSNLGLNVQSYEFKVPELNSANKLELFSASNVTFYGLADTDEIYYTYPKNTKFSEELQENLEYSIKADSDELATDKTILTISVEMDSNFLRANNYPSLAQYLSRFGYEASEYSIQTVLHNLASPINFDTVMKSKVTDALFEVIKEDEIAKEGTSNLNQICSIHKLDRDSDNYTLYVVYQDVNSDGDVFYYRRQFRACYLNDEVIVLSINNSDTTKEEYASNPYEGGQIVLNNTIIENTEEEVPEETETPVEEQTDVS